VDHRGRRPDMWDCLGALVVTVGVGVMFFAPKSKGA
jgi:drug/metabolite transporter superfamily protein YnfA